jgi:pilus assembly protein CpaB
MMGRLPTRVTLQRTAVRAVLAGGLGLTAMLAAEGWRAGAAEPMAEVWVTTRALAPGDRLTAADVTLRRWPAAAADAGWLGRGASPVGQTAAARLAAGTPISAAMFEAAGGSGLGAMLRPGRRAMSIAVGPAGGLAGFLAPGDHVDVLLTQLVGKRRTVQTLVTDLTVLGIDSRGRGDAPDAEADAFVDGPAPPGLVTLDVTPGEAEALAVAAELGTLSLALRGSGRGAAGERPHSPARSVRWDSDVTGLPADLFADTAPALPQPAPVAPPPAATPPAPAPPAPAGGIAISYGLQPTAAEPAK